MKSRLFYFVADTFPAWRSDVSELFGRELPARGLQVTWSMRSAEAGPARCVLDEGQTVYLPPSLGRKGIVTKVGNRVLEAANELRQFAGLLHWDRADVVQVRDNRYLAAFWAWLAARLTGARFVYWLSFPFPEHDAERAKTARGPRRLFLVVRARLASWWLYRFIMRRVDHVFVQSEAMANDIAAYGIDRRRMTPVPMGVPIRLLQWAAAHPRSIEPGLVAYIGTLSASRKLGTILEAFAIVASRHAQACLLMIGDGNVPGEREALERQAAELGIADRLRFTGFVPMSEVWRLVSMAAVGLSPFYPDRVQRVASPTKLVEYMALGCPVICNDHPEQSEIIRESGAGLCVPWGAEYFADAIDRLLTDPDEASRMGTRGPTWVAAHRTYPIIAEAVWQEYRRLWQ